MATVLRDNFSLLQAWNRLEQAQAVLRVQGAARYPSVQGTAGAGRTWSSEGGFTDSYSAGVSASYEVDIWGRIESAVDAAVFDAQARLEDLQAAAITLTAQTATTWYQLAADRERVQVLQQQVTTNQAILSIIAEQFANGQARAADVFRQRQLIAATEGRLAQARAVAAVREHQLAVLVGVPPQLSAQGEHIWHPTLVAVPGSATCLAGGYS